VQRRSFLSSLVYQSVQGESVDSLLELPGNRFAARNAPDKVIVPYVRTVDTLVDRLSASGEEQDVFEKAAFQKRVLEAYRSDWFEDLCAEHAVDVVYVDVSCGVEEAVQRTLRCVKDTGFFAENA
jgi:thymidylate kinase